MRIASACVYARHPRIKPHLSHFSFVESCHFRDQETQLPGVGMEFGEHIPTSSDESILGRDVPTSDSEDRPPTRIPRGRQGRTASSGGGAAITSFAGCFKCSPRGASAGTARVGTCDASVAGWISEGFCKKQRMCLQLKLSWLNLARHVLADVSNSFGVQYLWSWTFVEHFGP